MSPDQTPTKASVESRYIVHSVYGKWDPRSCWQTLSARPTRKCMTNSTGSAQGARTTVKDGEVREDGREVDAGRGREHSRVVSSASSRSVDRRLSRGEISYRVQEKRDFGETRKASKIESMSRMSSDFESINTGSWMPGRQQQRVPAGCAPPWQASSSR